MTDTFELDERGGDLPEACMPMVSLLQPFVDDELDPQDREAVAEHITDCPACLVEVQQQQTVRAALRQLEPEVIPEALLARIRAGLDEVDAELDGVLVLERPSRLRAFARGVGMMVPAAAAAAALFFVVQGGGQADGASARDALPMRRPRPRGRTSLRCQFRRLKARSARRNTACREGSSSWAANPGLGAEPTTTRTKAAACTSATDFGRWLRVARSAPVRCLGDVRISSATTRKGAPRSK